MALKSDMIDSKGLPVVVGLGTTGLSVARFLARQGRDFVVVDSREDPPGLAQLRQELPKVTAHCGALSAAMLTAAGQLYVSPGIALNEPAVAAAVDAGVPLAGDIDLFVKAARAPVVGITGSNAKSTVTELLGCMARRCDLQVGVGGNLGTPALELLAEDKQWYVLELSSFQLERAGELGLAVACILNLSEDHLDRHGDMLSYRRAKQQIFAGSASAVFNRDDASIRLPAELEKNCWSFGLDTPPQRGFGLLRVSGEEWLAYEQQPLLPVSALAMVGRHNIANALAALALGTAMQLPLSPMLAELREFSGLPHRCQLIASIAGVRYINDSKATNTGATLAALRGLADTSRIVLIAGGQGKDADFSELSQALAETCRAVVVIGEDAVKLQQAVPSSVVSVPATSLSAALSAAQQLAVEGDTVLLSPACASFDMFRSFVDRGDQFAQLVLASVDGEHTHG